MLNNETIEGVEAIERSIRSQLIGRSVMRCLLQSITKLKEELT